MQLAEILADLEGLEFPGKDGKHNHVQLLPALSAAELAKFAGTLPCALPGEIEDLLKHTRGLKFVRQAPDRARRESKDVPAPVIGWTVDITGESGGGQALDEIMPGGLSIASDECGNSWTVDLTAQSKQWGPLFYLCHDPPVVVYQCDTLADFLQQIKEELNFPGKSELHQMTSELDMQVWQNNPGALSRLECLDSPDSQLRAFAEELDDSYFVCDLRNARLGQGFSWGRFGAESPLRRYQSERLFAYGQAPPDKRPWWQRLFGQSRTE